MKEMTLYPASLETGRPHMCTQKNFSGAGETACVIQVERPGPFFSPLLRVGLAHHSKKLSVSIASCSVLITEHRH